MIAAARWLSIIGHPFVTSGVLVSSVAMRLKATSSDAVENALLVAATTAVPLLFLMIRQVRRGSWDNVDASNPDERPILFVVGIAGLAVLTAVLLYRQPGSFLIRGAIGVAAMLALAALVTRWIKASLHMAFCALGASILLLLRSPMAWVLLLLLPLLAWSRLALGRHTRTEIATGTVLGLVFGLAIFGL